MRLAGVASEVTGRLGSRQPSDRGGRHRSSEIHLKHKKILPWQKINQPLPFTVTVFELNDLTSNLRPTLKIQPEPLVPAARHLHPLLQPPQRIGKEERGRSKSPSTKS
eukprot:scaffold137738_cov29-Tisochrysis_lutea.AAC.2